MSCHKSAIVSLPEHVTPKRLRCFVVGCNNEHSRRSFTPDIRTDKDAVDYVCFKGNAPPIYLNAFKFAQIICNPASPTDEVSIKFFY